MKTIVKQEIQGLNGDEAVAMAVKQCDVDVIRSLSHNPTDNNR